MKLQRGISGARQTRLAARPSGTEVCRRVSVHRSSGLGACSTWSRPSAVMCAHQFIGDLAAASYEASRRPAAQYVEAEEEDEDEDYDEDGDEDGDEEGAEQGGKEAGAQQGAAAEEDPKDKEKTKQQQQQQQQQPQQPASEATLKAGAPPAAAAAPATAAAAATAAALPAEAKKDEDELVTQEYTEIIEVWDKPLTFQSVATDTVTWVRETNPGKAAAVTLAGTLLGTFALACHRYYRKYQSPKNVRKRQLARNKLLVDELSKVLPSDRAKLTPGFLKILGVRTGFTPVEIFRKYLWFMLRERKFDQGAVDDVVALKHAAGLKDQDVAEALRERSQRIYDKYGTLMLNTEGMTDAGIQRKAACQALFRKLMYLIEYEPLIKAGGPAAGVVDLRKIFGATEEDTEKLRIVSLYEDADLEKAYGLTITLDDDDDATSAAPPRRNP